MCIYLPVHVVPFPVYPALQTHVPLKLVFPVGSLIGGVEHMAFRSQVDAPHGTARVG